MKKLAIIMSTLILSMATFTWASNNSCPEGDINGNCNIGLEDAIFILKILAKHTDSQNQRDMEDVTNMNTRALSEAQSEVENLDHLASILAVMDLPANQPQKRNQTQDLFERLIESNMSCADISQDENAVVITFNQNPLCLGMSGSVRIIAASGAHSLVFEGVSTGNCVIEGKIIATITYNNENVVAELSFEDMSICGHPIDEDYTITYDKITGLLKSVDLKERLLTYVFENQNVQFPFQAVYDRLKGFTGSSTITRNGQTYNCQFKDFITNSMSGLPKTGIMNINDIQLDFKQQFSPDNPVISYIENDLPVQLKLTANKIQKGAKEFVAEIASQYQDVIGEISNIGALIVSKHGKDIEMLKQMAALPGTMKMTEYTSDSGINFQSLIADLAANGFNCGSASVTMMPPSIGYTFNGACDGIEGNVNASLSNGMVLLDYDNLTFGNGDCTIDGNMQVDVSFQNAAIQISQTTHNMNICGNTLNGNLVVINGIAKPLIIKRAGSDTLIINQTQYTIDSDIAYTQNAGISGSAEFSKEGKNYSCGFNNITIDPICGIPTSGTITFQTMVIDFSETACDNLVVNVTVFGHTVTMSLEELLNLLKNL